MYRVFNRGTGRYEVSDPDAMAFAAVFDQYHEALAFVAYKNNPGAYHFTSEQLAKILDEAIGMFLEYRNVHGYAEDQARASAVLEMTSGINADRELYLSGMDDLKLQLLFFS